MIGAILIAAAFAFKALKSAAYQRHLVLYVTAVIWAALFVAFPSYSYAQVVEQTNAWTQVASSDSNVTFYIGTTTQDVTLSSVGVFVNNPDGLGVDMQLRLTCYANSYSTSQTGCTTTSALTTASSTIYNTNAQVIYFSYTTPVTLQSGKVYLMEIMETTSQPTTFSVYGDTTYQFTNQCNPTAFGIGVQCSPGTPYFTFNSIPDWTGINATNTPLLALYDSDATTTLDLIQSRCVQDGALDFGYAICSATTFLFVPSPEIINGYAALPDTVENKFPFSWYTGLRDLYSGLVASSTSNMATVSVGFAAVDPAASSSFGAILPNMTVLSSSTITQYMPTGFLSVLLALETAALWVLFGFFIYREMNGRWLKH